MVLTERQKDERPTTGVFVAWDEEDVEVERRDAGTRHDRTVVTSRRTITQYALYCNEITQRNIDAAERYVAMYCSDYDNPRVEVFDGINGNVRKV